MRWQVRHTCLLLNDTRAALVLGLVVRLWATLRLRGGNCQDVNMSVS